jgi:hypothetical protein
LGYRKFVNRRSAAHKAPTAGGNTLTNYHREKDLEFVSARANLLFDAALGYAPAVGANTFNPAVLKAGPADQDG